MDTTSQRNKLVKKKNSYQESEKVVLNPKIVNH